MNHADSWLIALVEGGRRDTIALIQHLGVALAEGMRRDRMGIVVVLMLLDTKALVKRGEGA